MNGEIKDAVIFPVALSGEAVKVLAGPQHEAVMEIIAAEREACARVVEEAGGPDGDINYEVAERIAQRIRNRGAS